MDKKLIKILDRAINQKKSNEFLNDDIDVIFKNEDNFLDFLKLYENFDKSLFNLNTFLLKDINIKQKVNDFYEKSTLNTKLKLYDKFSNLLNSKNLEYSKNIFDIKESSICGELYDSALFFSNSSEKILKDCALLSKISKKDLTSLINNFHELFNYNFSMINYIFSYDGYMEMVKNMSKVYETPIFKEIYQDFNQKTKSKISQSIVTFMNDHFEVISSENSKVKISDYKEVLNIVIKFVKDYDIEIDPNKIMIPNDFTIEKNKKFKSVTKHLNNFLDEYYLDKIEKQQNLKKVKIK